MKKAHSSHTIFIFLGLLLLLFILVFGNQYFRSQYGFKAVEGSIGSEDYEDGRSIENPFFAYDDYQELNSEYEWIRFESDQIAFQYPNIFSLKIDNGAHISILPPKTISSESCDDILDEQAWALCVSPDYSPNVTVWHGNTIPEQASSLPERGREVINNVDWIKKSYSDEYGGTTWFISNHNDQPTVISYRHADTSGGQSFETLQAKLGKQYLLSASEQEDLVLDIISTLKIK